MKRFLFAGEGCVFFRRLMYHKMSHHHNFMGLKFIFLFLFFIIFSSCGALKQSESYDMPAHKFGIYNIGDKLPESFILGHDVKDSTKVYRLSDYKGKAVIIDAWATWCGSCISKFPLMDSLAIKYEGNLEILLVGMLGRSTPESIRDFVESYRNNNPAFNPSFLTEVIPLSDSFTIRFLPHYIWIDPNRRIRAFTDSKAFDDKNIKRLIAGMPVIAPVKSK